MRQEFNKKEGGAVMVTFALVLLVLLGFTAMAYEVGHWYLVRSELSKAVDSAALSAAANISNPHAPDFDERGPAQLAEDFAHENFRAGFLGTPSSGSGAVRFTATREAFNRVRVEGTVSMRPTLSRLFGMTTVSTQGAGVAQRNEVEIMLVLDRSGSMGGQWMADLKTATRSFVEFFEDTQDTDEMGLISFASTVVVNPPLGTYYVNNMLVQINSMVASGATNMEDALRRAGDESQGGLTDQTGIPGDQRKQQYVVFFGDGNPTAFRGDFLHNNTPYDAVGMVTSNCGPNENPVVWNRLGQTGEERSVHQEGPGSGDGYYPSGLNPRDTGDGLRTSNDPLTSCGYTSGWWWPTFTRYLNTKWEIFEERPIPQSLNHWTNSASHYPPDQCARYQDRVPDQHYYRRMARHICNIAWDLAVEQANYLKNQRNIKIYAIGLGHVNQDYIVELSSGPGFHYFTPSSSDLEAIFQEVARQIKLRLIQ